MTSNINELRRIIRFSWEELKLQCEWEECSLVDNHMHSYLHHIYTHLGTLTEDDLQCPWRDCGVLTGTKSELSRHVLFHAFHTKIKCYGHNLQQRKKLPNCLLELQSRNIIPELPDKLMCCWEGCDDTFDSPEAFYRHVDIHAENNKKGNNLEVPVICGWHGCNKTFSSLYKLKDHLRSHTQEKVMACPTCGGMFASRTKFLDHIQRQVIVPGNEDAGLQCGYCARKFTSDRLLRDHMRHHVNHYKCLYCDMTCPTPSGLQNHITYRHSNEKPFSCQYCDYKCKSHSDLRKHIDTHQPDAAYQCPVEGCNYSARSQTCFNHHIRKKHDGEKYSLYSCHLCTKAFTRGNYLTKHLVSRHRFRWPSGHCRFRYHRHDDGYYRLQTVRYESIELSEALLHAENDDVDNQNIVANDSPFSKETSDKQIVPEDIPCQDLALSSANNPHDSQSTQTSLVKIPVFMYLPENNGNCLNETRVKESQNTTTEYSSSAEQSVLLEIHGSNSKTLLTADGTSVVLLNMSHQAAEHNSSAVRTIQLVEKGQDGETVVQTAQVIADGNQPVELSSWCNSETEETNCNSVICSN